ncbi:MAG TPA: hypothetical protein VFY87_20555 [Geminicoccaceae bacterium]|nr:hypothetical protein [Geminicoccaceae bacterium]
MQALLEVRPGAVFVQSEPVERFHAEDPAALPRARLLNDKRFLQLDLLTFGHEISAGMRRHLLENGSTAEDERWFAERRVDASSILGMDYHETCERTVSSDGTVRPAGEAGRSLLHQWRDLLSMDGEAFALAC